MNIQEEKKKFIGFLARYEELKFLFIYRYISLLVTTIFFLFNDIPSSIANKIFVIASLIVTANILCYLYTKSYSCTYRIRLLVLIETIGNIVYLVPLGGINSPYVWYSLNTIIIASLMLGKWDVWVNLFIYIFGSTGIFVTIFQGVNYSFSNFLNQKGYLLSLILITYTIQLLGIYIKKVAKQNEILVATNGLLLDANRKAKNLIDRIMDLYSSIELFCTVKDKVNVLGQLLDCSKKITKSKEVIFFDFITNNRLIKSSESRVEITDEKLVGKIEEKKEEILNSTLPIQIPMGNDLYLCTAISTNYLNYGILGIKIDKNYTSLVYFDYIEILRPLSRLFAITLERFELELVNERLLVSEEQKRIASEIHDSALQRLFSISCAIYNIGQKYPKVISKEIVDELTDLREAINNTMKELRTTIYGLSWSKEDSDNFKRDIINYIEDIKKLNNVSINLNIVGREGLLTTIQRKAFYRVICEGISNAIHHGRASLIEINLNVNPNQISLQINDDGLGFNPKEMTKGINGKGLGLNNIYHLVYSLGGEIDLKTQIGHGTSIDIAIKKGSKFIEGEVV